MMSACPLCFRKQCVCAYQPTPCVFESLKLVPVVNWSRTSHHGVPVTIGFSDGRKDIKGKNFYGLSRCTDHELISSPRFNCTGTAFGAREMAYGVWIGTHQWLRYGGKTSTGCQGAPNMKCPGHQSYAVLVFPSEEEMVSEYYLK